MNLGKGRAEKEREEDGAGGQEATRRHQQPPPVTQPCLAVPKARFAEALQAHRRRVRQASACSHLQELLQVDGFGQPAQRGLPVAVAIHCPVSWGQGR